ncbi:MAG: hypothetical protein IMZ65_02815 [Planctomycetes bacterium]|nr:hypothetical protein [Planctomycetota bacterium]
MTEPSDAFLVKASDKIHTMFFAPAPKTHRTRFLEQVEIAVEALRRREEAREAAKKAAGAREAEYAKKAAADPRLRDREAGRPAKGLDWWPLPVRLADGTTVEGAWTPRELTVAKKLPPNPLDTSPGPDEAPAPPSLILAGQYFFLGVIHDDADRANLRGRPPLLEGIDLHWLFRVHQNYAPYSRCRNLPLCFHQERIEMALTDVAFDLAELDAKAQGASAGQTVKGTTMPPSRPPRKSESACRKPSSGRTQAIPVYPEAYELPPLFERLGLRMDESRPVPTRRDLKQVCQFWASVPDLARREGWPGGDDAERANRLISWLVGAEGILMCEAERLGLDSSPIRESCNVLCKMLRDNPRFGDKTTPPGRIAYWPQCLGASPAKGQKTDWQSAYDGDAALARLRAMRASQPDVDTPPAAAPSKAEKTVNPTVLKAADFIRANPGSKGRVIASACDDTEYSSFRTHIVPKLKEMGFTSRKGCNGGYYPPDARK